MRGAVVVLSVLLGLASASEAAVPAAPTPVAPSGVVASDTFAFVWGAVAGATWYQLWIDDAEASPRLARWYTATAAGCAGGGTCTVSLTDGLATGQVKWWVRGWNAEGNGPWSAGKVFTRHFQPPSWAADVPLAGRFQVLSGGEWVLDRQTGLVWQREPASDTANWLSARANCLFVSSGVGRLPAFQELRSVITAFPGQTPETPFVGIRSRSFWSATDYPLNQSAIYTGFWGWGTSDKASTFSYWCVRGAGTTPP